MIDGKKIHLGLKDKKDTKDGKFEEEKKREPDQRKYQREPDQR